MINLKGIATAAAITGALGLGALGVGTGVANAAPTPGTGWAQYGGWGGGPGWHGHGGGWGGGPGWGGGGPGWGGGGPGWGGAGWGGGPGWGVPPIGGCISGPLGFVSLCI